MFDRSCEPRKPDWGFQLNPHAAPFVPSSTPSFAFAAASETLNQTTGSENKTGSRTDDEATPDKSADAEYHLPDSLSLDFHAESLLAKPSVSAEPLSLSRAEAAAAAAATAPDSSVRLGGGSGVHHLPGAVSCLSHMFPDVSVDFIVHALRLQEFDFDFTVDMLSHLVRT